MHYYFFFLGLKLLEVLWCLIYRRHLPHFAVLAKSRLHLPRFPVHSTPRSSGLNTTSALFGMDSVLTRLSPSILYKSPLILSKQPQFFCPWEGSTPGCQRHSHQVWNKDHQVLTAGGQLGLPHKAFPRLYQLCSTTVPRELWEFTVCEKAAHNASMYRIVSCFPGRTRGQKTKTKQLLVLTSLVWALM